MLILKSSSSNLHMVWKKSRSSLDALGSEQQKLVGFEGHWQVPIQEVIIYRKIPETN